MFLWGAATSAHQVEGDNRLNDWWQWEEAGRVREKSGIACDHYNRFRQDFEIAKGLGHNAHRFSLEWSRLEPDDGRWDEKAWDHYRDVVKTLRSFGIEPIVTLSHFTLPLWFYKKGGWLCEGAEGHFRRFAEKAVRSLGSGVKYWITLNEPLVYVSSAYVKDIWPPGRRDPQEAFKVVGALIRSHNSAYKAMREVAKSLFAGEIMVGVANNIPKYEPYNPNSLMDGLVAFLHHYNYNLGFLRAIKGTMDFIGVNYYSRSFVRYTGPRSLKLASDLGYNVPQGREAWRNSLGWEVYPKGLYDILKGIARFNLPLMVTENGICTNNDGERSKFIKEHLDSLFKAKDEGAPVMGYLYWSLLDNFEWADGYGPRFGLVGVDYKTQARDVRPSGRFFADYIAKSLSERGLNP